MAEELWDLRTAATYLGTTEATLRSYLARHQMPEPDFKLGGSPIWYADTIREWHRGRPSQRTDET